VELLRKTSIIEVSYTIPPQPHYHYSFFLSQQEAGYRARDWHQ